MTDPGPAAGEEEGGVASTLSTPHMWKLGLMRPLMNSTGAGRWSAIRLIMVPCNSLSSIRSAPPSRAPCTRASTSACQHFRRRSNSGLCPMITCRGETMPVAPSKSTDM